MSASTDNLMDLIYSPTDPVTLAVSTVEMAERLSTGGGPIPLGSNAAWREIQASDENCSQFIDLKRTGQLPAKNDPKKEDPESNVKKMLVKRRSHNFETI